MSVLFARARERERETRSERQRKQGERKRGLVVLFFSLAEIKRTRIFSRALLALYKGRIRESL